MGTSTTSQLPVEHRSGALAVMRRMFEEGFATGETDVVDELCAADLVEHQFGMAGVGSGRPVDITVVDIARIVDGRIVEHWGVPDRFALLAQTGVLGRLT